MAAACGVNDGLEVGMEYGLDVRRESFRQDKAAHFNNMIEPPAAYYRWNPG
jgi:hypothetical protein